MSAFINIVIVCATQIRSISTLKPKRLSYGGNSRAEMNEKFETFGTDIDLEIVHTPGNFFLYRCTSLSDGL